MRLPMNRFLISLSALALAGFAGAALAQSAAITLEAGGDPSAASRTFATQIAARYPIGADYATARADVERNGFACETLTPDPQHDAPSASCTRSASDGRCQREWAIDLAQTSGRLRHPAEGSFALLCVGAVLPPKPR
jgi:hypothetical protein